MKKAFRSAVALTAALIMTAPVMAHCKTRGGLVATGCYGVIAAGSPCATPAAPGTPCAPVAPAAPTYVEQKIIVYKPVVKERTVEYIERIPVTTKEKKTIKECVWVDKTDVVPYTVNEWVDVKEKVKQTTYDRKESQVPYEYTAYEWKPTVEKQTVMEYSQVKKEVPHTWTVMVPVTTMEQRSVVKYTCVPKTVTTNVAVCKKVWVPAAPVVADPCGTPCGTPVAAGCGGCAPAVKTGCGLFGGGKLFTSGYGGCAPTAPCGHYETVTEYQPCTKTYYERVATTEMVTVPVTKCEPKTMSAVKTVYETVCTPKVVDVTVQKCFPVQKKEMRTVVEMIPVTKEVEVTVKKCVAVNKTMNKTYKVATWVDKIVEVDVVTFKEEKKKKTETYTECVATEEIVKVAVSTGCAPVTTAGYCGYSAPVKKCGLFSGGLFGGCGAKVTSGCGGCK
jgi:hypothetical protein